MEYPSFSVLMSLYIKEKAEYFDECIEAWKTCSGYERYNRKTGRRKSRYT